MSLNEGQSFSSSYMCHVCNKVFSQGSTLSKHLKKNHNFKWPSGHSRFRYKLEHDGFYRLQKLRYESLELFELLNKNEVHFDSLTANQNTDDSVKSCGAANSPSLSLINLDASQSNNCKNENSILTSDFTNLIELNENIKIEANKLPTKLDENMSGNNEPIIFESDTFQNCLYTCDHFNNNEISNLRLETPRKQILGKTFTNESHMQQPPNTKSEFDLEGFFFSSNFEMKQNPGSSLATPTKFSVYPEVSNQLDLSQIAKHTNAMDLALFDYNQMNL